MLSLGEVLQPFLIVNGHDYYLQIKGFLQKCPLQRIICKNVHFFKNYWQKCPLLRIICKNVYYKESIDKNVHFIENIDKNVPF